MSIVCGNFFPELLDSKLCNAVGKISLVSGNSEYYVNIVAGELVDLSEKSTESLVISSADLEDRINEDILDIVVTCEETCNETEECLKRIDAVLVGVNDSYGVTDIVSELVALINADNIAVGVLGSSIDHINEYLSLT